MFRGRHRGGAGDILEFTRDVGHDPFRFVGFHPREFTHRIRPFARGRRGPSMITLLLAGLAVFAFVKLMSARNNRRSTAEKLLIGALLLLVGAVVLTFRRSSRRYRA